MPKTKAERNVDEEEGMGPLERGRRRYLTKDYEGALLAFKEAVEMSTNHMLLIALDHRAATHEKLKDFKSALRDAREMLKLKPQLVKGYLRVGKVLQLMKQDALALQMYQRGLEKVKIGGDEDRTILQSMFNKLQRKIAPTPCDPLVKLPTELVEMIFQYLNMRDRVICLSVLKTWKRVLESLPRLWNVLDTTAARRAVTEKALKAYLKRSKYTVETARIAMRPAESGGFNATKMSYLTRTCKTLRDLEIDGPGLAGDSLVKALPETENLQRLFVNTNCQVLVGSLLRALDSTKATLREASFLSIETGIRTMAGDWQGPKSDLLTTLRLQAHPSKGYAPLFNLRGLVEAFPNLEVLCVTRWDVSSFNSSQMDLTKWSKLKHLNLNDNGLLELPLLPPTLEYLDLGRNLHLFSNTNLDGERNNLPLLKYFNCYCTNLRGTTIGALTKPSITTGNLKTFNCGGIDPYLLRTAADVEQTFLASDIMEEFSLADAHLDEDKVLQIVKRYPNLQVLDVSSAKITGSAIREFVEMGIKRVKANNCREISPDALQYALQKGVQLECRCPLAPVNRFRDITNIES